jgi:hypothetical protein
MTPPLCAAQAQPGGTIRRSGLAGAGAAFRTSAIPLTIFELNKCTAVAPHIHPNGAETIFVLEGEHEQCRVGRCLPAWMLCASLPVLAGLCHFCQ